MAYFSVYEGMVAFVQDIKHTKKLVSVIIALAIVMTSLIPSIAVLADDPAGGVGSQPKIKIIGSTIKNSDDFFELSVEIDPRIVGFSSLAAVLQYRTDIIVPVAWDEGGTEVPLTGNNWQNIAAVPAVAPAEISGKTALTYKEPGSSTDPGTEPSANPGTEPSAEPVVNPSAEPTTKSASSNIAYLYLSSEAPLPEPVDTTIDTTNNAAPDAGKLNGVVRTITVRFKYVGTGEDEDAVKAAKAASKQYVIDNFAAGNKDVVSLAPDAVAASSPAGQCIVYSADETVKEFYYTPDNSATIGLKIGTLMTAAPTFELKQDEDTANSGGGGADPANFIPVVYYDWDGTTLLGASVVDASNTSAIESLTFTYASTLVPPGAGFDLNNWDDTKAAALDVYNTAYPLTSHDGYTFGKWIDFNSKDGEYTVYGKVVNVTSAGSLITIPCPSDPEYLTNSSYDMSKGLILKAAYISNVGLDELTTAVMREYDVSYDTSPDSDCFERFGTTQNYSVTVSISRMKNGKGVHRTCATALRVAYVVNGVTMNSLVSLEDKDEQTVEVAVPNTSNSVSFSVIDTGGVSNWIGGTAARGAASVTAQPNANNEGFVILGTTHSINRQVATELAPTASLGAAYFTNFIDISDASKVAGCAPGANASARRKQATQNIREGQHAKAVAAGDSDPGSYKYLSYQEMCDAVLHGNYNYTAENS